MRYVKPTQHKARKIVKFAWIPIKLYDNSEIRWLELCCVEQRYCDWGNGLEGWKNIRFFG